jgi:ABC-type multidrug transport system ATPase subunit
MTTAPPVIETRGLTKRFGGRTAVSDLSLTVPAGCAFGFLGHNGAGKTTVIRMLVSLMQPSAGDIRIGGQPLGGHREHRGRHHRDRLRVRANVAVRSFPGPHVPRRR